VSAFNKFASFIGHVCTKKIDLSADVFRIYLTNTAPNAGTMAVKADLAEITAGNGYAAGGATPTVASASSSAGTFKLVLNDVTITAAGGTVGPFRYAVLYDDTPAGTPTDPLAGWWDYGSSISLGDGESITVDLDNTNGVLTFT
jgi:hypothetical protein